MESMALHYLYTVGIILAFIIGYKICEIAPNAQIIDNKLRRFGAASQYVYIKMKIAGDVKGAFHAMFTPKEIMEASERAEKNSEDLDLL